MESNLQLGLPEGAIIDAIWRCAVGHERPAAFHTPNATVTNYVDFHIQIGEKQTSVCMVCLSEAYPMTRVEFKEERCQRA